MHVEDARSSEGRALRILLVEDSQDDAEIMLDELRDGGYSVEYERVETERELRAALPRGPWHLVLCDYTLPQFDALQALRLMQELQPNLPFIVVSGAVGEEIAIRVMKAGAHDFLLKGNLSRLVPAVARELAEAELRAERVALREQLLLSDRLVQVGTLAAGVAHEINNPLAYVMGNIEYALRELSSPVCVTSVPESVTESLATALEGTRRIRATAEDLRLFSRVGDGRPHPVDLRRVLESAIGMATTQMRYRARLVRDLEDVPLIVGNENRLGQVFLNLLINAAQAIPEGHADDNEIVVRLRRAAHSLVVEVSDTGQGIPKEIQSRLFQPFVTSKSKEEGTGLGLSICRNIVHEYRGAISARANPDRGTTFQVRLPLTEAQPAPETPSQSQRAPTQRRRLLVIDDEPEILELIHRELRTEHEVVGVAGASEALAWLSSDPAFDIILSDLMMPGMSGMQLYAELGRCAPALSQRIIFMTGGAFSPAASKFLSEVRNLCITKPFTAAQLYEAIRRTLRRTGSVPPALGAAS